MDKTRTPILQRAAAALTRTTKNINNSTKLASTVAPKKEVKKNPSKNILQDEIAVRAYFISERRQEMGWSGNHESDWIEAEKQLRAETQ